MKDITNVTNDYRVFELLEKSVNLSLADRARLASLECEENFLFTCDPENITQDIKFFSSKKYELEFIQNGEFLTFEHLDTKAVFVGYQKKTSASYCPLYQKDLRILWAFNPSN